MPFDESKTPELRAPEQNQFLAEVARYLSAIEGGIDKYAELPLDLLLPVSSEFVEKLSYGDPLFRMAPKGTGSRIPQTTDREYLMDALFGAGMVSPAARGVRDVAKSALGSMRRARRAPNEGQMATDELSAILNALDQQQVPKFGKGGAIDFLAQTLLGKSKAKATKDAPDPSRRAAIGLPKDVTPKPGEVVVKEEVKKSPKKGETTASITEAMNVPMSRRDVLRAGVGQAIQAAAPRGAMGALMKAAGSTPMSVAKEVVKAAPLSPTTFAGIVAQGIKKGKSNEQIAKSYLKSTGQDLDPDFIEEMAEYDVARLRDPYSVFDASDELYAPGPLDILNRFLNRGSDEPLRKTLREIKAVNPDLYKELIEAARQTDIDIAEMSPSLTYQNRLEAAQERAAKLGIPFDEAKFRDYYGYEEDFDPKSLFDEMDDEDYYD
jgi:hypothetical protein